MDTMGALNAKLDAIVLQVDACAGERMLQAVYDFLGRFVCYPTDHARVAHALWCVHTHLMDRWDTTPRIAFLSPEPGSGKSRALEITELLVPNPVPTMNVSPAYLFRKIGAEEGAATILFDEIDTVFGPKAKENEEIRGLLNAGYRRGQTAGRCVVRGKNIETEDLPAYSAVALAGLGWLPDTILTRAVIVRMRKRHAGEPIEAYRRRVHAPAGEVVRQKIEIWSASFPAEICWPELPGEIQDRDADVWEPLVVVADAAGGKWPKLARDAAVALVLASKDADPSLGVRLLADLRTVFGGADEMSSKTILEALWKMEEAPWSDIHGKPLNERGLAQRLKAYGVRSKTIRTGMQTPKGYARADLHDNWKRYLPSLEPVGSTTGATDGVCANSKPEPDPDGWSFNLEDEAPRCRAV